MKCYTTRFLDAFNCHICGPIGYSIEKHLVEIKGVLEAVCVQCCPAKHAAAILFEGSEKSKYHASCSGSLPEHKPPGTGAGLPAPSVSGEALTTENGATGSNPARSHQPPEDKPREAYRVKVYTGSTPEGIPCPEVTSHRASDTGSRCPHSAQLALRF